MSDEERKIEIEETSPENLEKQKKEEDAIKALVEVVTEANKKMDDVYDETVRRVDMKKRLIPFDEKLEEAHKQKVQLLVEKYEELRAKISSCRREGKDPLIADFMSRSIPAKIKMAQVTRELKDFQEVEQNIKRCLEELEEAEKEEIVNVKKELELKYRNMIQKETGVVKSEDD